MKWSNILLHFRCFSVNYKYTKLQVNENTITPFHKQSIKLTLVYAVFANKDDVCMKVEIILQNYVVMETLRLLSSLSLLILSFINDQNYFGFGIVCPATFSI